MSKHKLQASQRNTILDDIAVEIGLRATVLLAAWWGGRNIVVPAARPDRSVIAQVIGVEATRRLSAAWGGEQLFIPRLNWLEEVRKARQAYNLRAHGFGIKEIGHLMVLTTREVENLVSVGRFAAEAVAMEGTGRRGAGLFDLEPPELREGAGGSGGRRKGKASAKAGEASENPAAGSEAA